MLIHKVNRKEIYLCDNAAVVTSILMQVSIPGNLPYQD